MATTTEIKNRINSLSPAGFQIFCDELLTKEGYSGIVSLGTKSGESKTTKGTPDSYFCLPNGKYVFIEYSTQKDNISTKIKEDLDKCLDENVTNIPISEIVEIIYCHTSSNLKPSDDRSLKLQCEEKGIKLSLMGIDVLSEKATNFPSVVKDHLHLTISTEQIQSLDDFIKNYNSKATAATLDTDFLFRDKEMKEIDEAFERSDVVLLTGVAGSGKTRLALEYAKKHASISEEKVYCIHNNSQPIYDDLKACFEIQGSYFVIIDDANQLSEIKHVVEYVNKKDKGYCVHILLTVRDYALSKVKEDISEVVQIETIRIDPFKDEEIISLMKNHYGILNRFYLDRIVQIAEGNTRIAIIAGKIACETNRLDSINDASELYYDYFGRVLKETNIESNDNLLISAGIVVFLHSINLDYIESILPILEEKGITKEDFVNNLRILHNNEIVDIYYDKGVVFSEQCMSNFVLKYVFYDKKIIKLSSMIEACFDKYRKRTIYAINTLFNVFRNIDLHEYVKDEIKVFWNQYDEQSSNYLDFLKVFYSIDEIKTLKTIKNLVDNEKPVIVNISEIDTKNGKKYQNIDNDIIHILSGFSNLENIDAALDLFFQYYLKRPDLYMQFYHALLSGFSIDKDSAGYKYTTQIKLFSKIVEYSQNWENDFITTLFLDITDYFLKLEFTVTGLNRNEKSMVFQRIPLTIVPGVKEYRRIIWEQLLILASKSHYNNIIKSILASYGESLSDNNKEVVKFDSDYICELVKSLFSVDSLKDCLIVQSLQETFESADYHTEELRSYMESDKFRLYQTINRYDKNFDIPYEECEKIRKNSIKEFIISQQNKTVAIKGIIGLLNEKDISSDVIYQEIGEAINIALEMLVQNSKEYIECVIEILFSGIIAGINKNHIVEVLFSMLNSNEVFGLLSKSNLEHRNEWLFAYYQTIPKDLINQKELDGLYTFLADESDCYISSSPYRGISFLDKYLDIDDNVVINASKIIMNKKDYSPFMVSIYFGLLINENAIKPNELVKKYSKDITLLEDIYLYLLDNEKYADYKGLYLHELFKTDSAFVDRFIKWFINKYDYSSLNDCENLIQALFREEDYIDRIDYLVEESIECLSIPSLQVPYIIKYVLIPLNEEKDEYYKNKESWIEHFIEQNYSDMNKMNYLFEALAEISLGISTKYIPLLIKHTDDFSIFNAIKLTPASYSWTESFVPLLSSWIESLEKLLPLFSGFKFINHKEKVEKLIESLKKRKKEEEISDILEG